ncbi:MULTISPECIES: hypothetical protein [unclassified Nostoc]|uniref:hypothetical protein n=1 Tax=unclassified Nostoc TaxID=2593658 RepID=UPI0025E346B5|nr:MULTISPECIES: hypothetical protein [unclassified Nostoc]MBN3993352.1 hypothetical protein [Nostoc sp. NMS2]
MAELSYMQELESDACGGLRLRISKLSAHLMGTSFQPFASSQITTHRVIISAIASVTSGTGAAYRNYLKFLLTQVASYPPRRTLQATAHNKMYGCATHNHHSN